MTDVVEADVIVSGAGASGLLAAIALGRAGHRVTCVGRSDTRPTGRTVALFEGSLRFLRSLDLLGALQDDLQPIKAIRIIDDTGARWAAPSLTLHARDLALDALGGNIPNHRLVMRLLAVAQAMVNVRIVDGLLRDIRFAPNDVTATDDHDVSHRATLMIGADGRRSPARLAAAIGTRQWTYPQTALTAFLAHEKPHGEFSTEFHTRNGPCTLVPLQAEGGQPNRSSLVWLMAPREAERRYALSDDMFAAELERQTRSTVGRITMEPVRGRVPMGGLAVNRLAAPRLVLIGEAAHAFPPLAAQGLNLSIRDVAQLLATLRHAPPADLGAVDLRRYEKARRRDIAVRTNSVDVLNRSILTDMAPVDIARGVGATALRLIGPLRRAVLREGILPAMPG